MMGQLYTDGGIVGQNPSKIGGTWAWCLVENGSLAGWKSGIVTPTDSGLPIVSNNFAELYAAVMALASTPPGWKGTLFTDSAVTLFRLTNSNAFAGIPGYLHKLAKDLRSSRRFDIVLLGGHPTKRELLAGCRRDGRPCSVWNVFVDKQCRKLAARMARKELLR